MVGVVCASVAGVVGTVGAVPTVPTVPVVPTVPTVPVVPPWISTVPCRSSSPQAVTASAAPAPSAAVTAMAAYRFGFTLTSELGFPKPTRDGTRFAGRPVARAGSGHVGRGYPSSMAPERDPVPGRLAMPRSRGLASGVLVALLGAWAAAVPFIGPWLGLELMDEDALSWDPESLWLSILPGVAAVAGGWLMARARNRASGALGGWLALAGGAWLLVAPALRLAFDDVFGYGATDASEAIEQIAFFFGPGTAITALSAFALGRMSLRGHRDPGVVEERPLADVERRRLEREREARLGLGPSARD